MIPSTLPLAQLYGGKELSPEESINRSLDSLELLSSFFSNQTDWTVDVYSIAVDGRLALSKNLSLLTMTLQSLLLLEYQELEIFQHLDFLPMILQQKQEV